MYDQYFLSVSFAFHSPWTIFIVKRWISMKYTENVLINSNVETLNTQTASPINSSCYTIRSYVLYYLRVFASIRNREHTLRTPTFILWIWKVWIAAECTPENCNFIEWNEYERTKEWTCTFTHALLLLRFSFPAHGLVCLFVDLLHVSPFTHSLEYHLWKMFTHYTLANAHAQCIFCVLIYEFKLSSARLGNKRIRIGK